MFSYDTISIYQQNIYNIRFDTKHHNLFTRLTAEMKRQYNTDSSILKSTGSRLQYAKKKDAKETA